MANNDNNHPRRDPSRPEDNPFIAFRRFADSQVSSLLNTVFTLPATIANYNYAHQAREQCLFGKADQRQCDRLHELEAEITELRHEGKDLFRTGDLQAVLRNSEELLRLDRSADELRRDIVDKAESTNRENATGHDEAALVERVANAKGQEWGWSWDWGFPRPFDHDGKASGGTAEDEAARQAREIELMLHLQSEVKKMIGDSRYDDAMAAVMKVFHDDDTHAEFSDKEWNDVIAEVPEKLRRSDSGRTSREPRVWQWPPPADSSRHGDNAYSPRVLEEDQEMNKAGVQWQKAYEDLLRSEQNERPHCMRSDEPIFPHRRRRRGMFPHEGEGRSRELEPQNESKWVPQEDLEANDEPSYEYAHDHEDQHDDPPTPKMQQDSPFTNISVSKGEQDAMVPEDDQILKFLEQQHAQERQTTGLLEQDAQKHSKTWQSEQQDTMTELDVYEQLLAAKEQPSTPSAPVNNGTAKPSVLSTLTTTERTVAPDGSVTTKVVLKKRFADGREESSETVHTHRGQEDNARPQDPWKAMQDAQAPLIEQHGKKEGRKRSGWFWSS